MKLVRGMGSPKEGACWMSALSWYSGEPWTDFPSCVGSMLVRQLCMALNDFLRNSKERERFIGPHLFAPLGILGGAEREIKRLHLVMAAYAEIAPVLETGVSGSRRDNLRRHHATAILMAHDAIAYRNTQTACVAATALCSAILTWNDPRWRIVEGPRQSKKLRQIREALTHRWVKLILDCCAVGERVEITEKRALCNLP